jgi:acylphosphatase
MTAGNAKTEARRYFVRGRVQGVGYRDFVQRAARDLGLSGFARNLDDGRVEVLAMGTPDQLGELAGRLHKGPRFADVRGVEEYEATPEKHQGFWIR